jgi:hypothetical protein
MDPKYEDLEKDIVEKLGAGRCWQEMAKNPALPGSNTANPHPEGIHPNLMKHKTEKTLRVIDAEFTQVTRREKE